MALFTQEELEELRRADAELDMDNREKINQKQRTYRNLNREKYNAYQRAYRKAHREKCSEYNRAYKRKKRAEAHAKSKEE